MKAVFVGTLERLKKMQTQEAIIRNSNVIQNIPSGVDRQPGYPGFWLLAQRNEQALFQSGVRPTGLVSDYGARRKFNLASVGRRRASTTIVPPKESGCKLQEQPAAKESRRTSWVTSKGGQKRQRAAEADLTLLLPLFLSPRGGKRQGRLGGTAAEIFPFLMGMVSVPDRVRSGKVINGNEK